MEIPHGGYVYGEVSFHEKAHSANPPVLSVNLSLAHCAGGGLYFFIEFSLDSGWALKEAHHLTRQLNRTTMPFSDLWNLEQNYRRVLFWRLQILSWSAFALVQGFVIVVFLQLPGSFVLTSVILRTVLGICATSFILRPLLQRFREYGIAKAILMVAPIIFVIAFVDAWLVRFTANRLLTVEEIATIKIFTNAAIRNIVLFFWSILYLVTDRLLRVQEEVLRLSRLESEQKSAELHLLRNQMSPHFLFNALTAVEAVAGEKDKVIEITQLLSGYLRLAVRNEAQLNTLQQEMDALESYLKVEKLRFGDDIEYKIDISAAAYRASVPAALVQPLLENAVKHGSKSAIRPLFIEIWARVHQGELLLHVRNSGQWIMPSKSDSGTGLPNLRRRLELICGKRAVLDIQNYRSHVLAEVRLPVSPLPNSRTTV